MFPLIAAAGFAAWLLGGCASSKWRKDERDIPQDMVPLQNEVEGTGCAPNTGDPNQVQNLAERNAILDAMSKLCGVERTGYDWKGGIERYFVSDNNEVCATGHFRTDVCMAEERPLTAEEERVWAEVVARAKASFAELDRMGELYEKGGKDAVATLGKDASQKRKAALYRLGGEAMLAASMKADPKCAEHLKKRELQSEEQELEEFVNEAREKEKEAQKRIQKGEEKSHDKAIEYAIAKFFEFECEQASIFK